MQRVSISNKTKRFACTTEHYNDLYSRYLQNPAKLLEMAGYQPGQRLLDLCGGTGAISLAALALGGDPSQVTLIDLKPRCQDKKIRQLAGSALSTLKQINNEGEMFDVAICRQAFAYLHVEGKSGEELAQSIANLIQPGGFFIFNSFIRPRFHFKSYQFKGRRFIELAGYLRRRIFRLQIGLGVGYDFSISKWHREERIFEIFNPYFNIETRWSENAVYWICTRR